MRKILFLILTTIILNSCKLQKVIIVEKWDPVDWHENRVYPIKDTMACAVGFTQMGGEKVFYGRDKRCYIISEFELGDTILVYFKYSKLK